MPSFIHDQQAIRRFGWDWTDDLPAGTTITTSTWAISPDTDPTALSDSTHNDASTAVVLGQGLTPGVMHKLVNHVVFSDDEEDDCTLYVRCIQR